MQFDVRILPLIFIALAALACNFSSDSRPTLTHIPAHSSLGTSAPTNTASPTMNPSATAARAATTSSSSTGGSSSTSLYVVNLPAPAPNCSVSPTGNFDVNIRSSNNLNASIVGSLKVASWIKVDWHQNGWFRIDYPGTPVDNLWISDDPVTLVQPCQCTPDCLPDVPTVDSEILYSGPNSDCRVDYTRPDPISIYSQPNDTSRVLATLERGEFSFAFAQRNQWYKIYIPEISGYGWVPMGMLDIWGGVPCTTLPVEAMPATNQCIVVNTSGQNVGAYSSPDESAGFALRFPAGMSAIGLEQQGEWLKVRMEQGLWPDTGEYWVRAASFRTEGPCNFSG